MTSLLIQHIITTTLLASLVWVVCRLAKPAPAAKHILWSLVILKLMIPPMGEMSVTIPALRSAEPTEQAATTPKYNMTESAQHESRPPVQAAETNLWEGEAPAEPLLRSDIIEEIAPLAASTKTVPAPTPARSAPPINWPMLAIAAWLCGAFLLATLQLIRWQRFTAQTAASGETPAWLNEEAQTIAERLGCKRVEVTLCNRLSTPAVAGVLKPRILVPSALLDRLPRDRWSALLAHELAHVKRHDTWWRMLELASGIVWFWNPVFWFARKQTRTAAEHACDAWVVWALPKDRRTYANSLVDVSEWASTPTLPATAIGMSAANRQKLEARLTSIVSGKISRHTSRAMRITAAILLAASIPGWAIEENTEQQTQPKLTKSTPPTEFTKSTPIVLAQAETKAKPSQRPPAKRTNIDTALDQPLSIEFDDEHIGTILEFISSYADVNIVLDHSVVEEERPSTRGSMPIVHVGPHWYKYPRRDFLGTAEWPKSQVVNGMVGPFDGEVTSLPKLLGKLLPDAGMTYAVTPSCIWITVARPEFEIVDDEHEPRNWIWYSGRDEFLRSRSQSMQISTQALNDSVLPSDKALPYETEKVHIAEIARTIHQMFARQKQEDGNTNVFQIPPIVVDAAAIAPPKGSDYPKSYLIANDPIRLTRLNGGAVRPSSKAATMSPAEAILSKSDATRPVPVTSGMVPFVKLDNVPLNSALTALLRPLNLTYLAESEFIYITSPKRAQSVDFADRTVPTEVRELGKALNQPVHIEFENQHVGTILEFVSAYVDINIVVDSRAVLPEDISVYRHTGTKPVTTGHVPFIMVKDLSLANMLKVLLTPLDLDYSIESDFIWISSPEFIAAETFTASTSAPDPKPQPRPEAAIEPRNESPVRAKAATVTARKPGPTIDGYTFRRITRWEDSDGRVEVAFGDNQKKWYEIGEAFGPIEIADIDVIANQVLIDHRDELKVLQLSWPVPGPDPTSRPKRTARSTSRWTWTDIPYGNVKFGPIARWENSDPRLQVEFPDGTRKWLEVGAAIGNARIGGINIIANQVIVRTPEKQTRTFDLPRPVQDSSAAAQRPKAGRKFSIQATWTPVTLGDITIGRLARWEDSGDPFIEVQTNNGERKIVELDQSIAGIKIVSIDIIQNQVVVQRNGKVEVVQLPTSSENSEVAPAPSQATRLNPRSDGNIGVGDQRWIDYIGDWSRQR